MKTQLTFLLTFLVVYSIAQVPNGTFETWLSGGIFQKPDQWQTLNELAYQGNPVSAFSETGPNKFSGQSSLRLTTIHISKKDPALKKYLPDTFGLAFTGTVNFSPPSLQYGYPSATRPQFLNFNAKYFPTGKDSAKVFIVLLKRIGGLRDTIAYGQKVFGSTPSYSLFTIPLNYHNQTLQPDTCVIVLLSSHDTLKGRVGSTLYIDNIDISGGDVGISSNLMQNNLFRIYPNPTSEYLLFETNTQHPLRLKLIDGNGKQVLNEDVQPGITRKDVKQFPPGVYYYFLDTPGFEESYSGRFVIRD